MKTGRAGAGLTSVAVAAAAALAAAVASSGTPIAAQELAQQVAAVGDGTVRLAYATRDGVEICAQGIRMGDQHMMWYSRGWGEEPTECRVGSAEVELRVRDGEARAVEILRRARDRTEGATDLGVVPADRAARFFLALAREGSAGKDSEDFVLPAYLADVPEIWRGLLELAKDRSMIQDVRTSALFWVGQEAAEAATRGLADVAYAEDEEEDVREAAVFALSQQPNDRAVPLLMDLARTAPQAGVRRSALFWLAQSKDERVLPFFEEILVRRGGG